jgi:dTDP-L-rhamnose 4-epimerase
MTDKLDGRAVNVGSGRAVTILEIARIVSNALGKSIEPEIRGEFRPGEMRHLTSDTTLIREAGYSPQVDIENGIDHYLDWIRAQAHIKDYFSEAEQLLKSKGIVQRVGAANRWH